MRDSFNYAIEHIRPRLKIVAEVGVASGDNALDMLTNYPIEYMLLVDCYLPYSDIANSEVISLEKQNIKFKQALNNLLPRQLLSNVVFSCMESVKIASYYSDNFFDYVYIDASHDYDNVKRDIEIWFTKVKVGGILAGHDYQGYYDGVTRAVDEFKDKNQEKLEFKKFIEYDWAFHKK